MLCIVQHGVSQGGQIDTRLICSRGSLTERGRCSPEPRISFYGAFIVILLHVDTLLKYLNERVDKTVTSVLAGTTGFKCPEMTLLRHCACSVEPFVTFDKYYTNK